MAKRSKKRVNKAAAVREYLEAQPDATPSEIVKVLAAKGIEVSRHSAAAVKYRVRTDAPPSRGTAEERMASLTPRQRDIYEFTKGLILNRGYGPSVREIGTRFSIRSPNGVMCHLKALQAKGMIRRTSNISRGIELVDKPASATSVESLGQLSSGRPLTAPRGNDTVDFADVLGSGDNACVAIKDDSCRSDGLERGDYVLIQKQDTCRNGDRILVIVDGQTTALKRYVEDDNGVRLEPLAGKGKAIRPQAVSVLGVVTGVVRKV